MTQASDEGRRGARPGTTAASADAAWLLVFSAWLVATASSLGALFLSEVMEVAPCVLCWYQRAFMFPLVLVLAAGLFPQDRTVLRYALPLALAGWLVALFHLLLTRGVIAEALAPCTQGVPCSRIEVEWLGFVTIPLLSLLAFTVIASALVVAHLKTRS